MTPSTQLEWLVIEWAGYLIGSLDGWKDTVDMVLGFAAAASKLGRRLPVAARSVMPQTNFVTSTPTPTFATLGYLPWLPPTLAASGLPGFIMALWPCPIASSPYRPVGPSPSTPIINYYYYRRVGPSPSTPMAQRPYHPTAHVPA